MFGGSRFGWNNGTIKCINDSHLLCTTPEPIGLVPEIFRDKSYLESLSHQEKWLHLYREDKIGVSIIDSIPHCHIENAFKRGNNQEMILRFYIEDKVGVSIINSISHCHTENVFKRGKIMKCGFVFI